MRNKKKTKPTPSDYEVITNSCNKTLRTPSWILHQPCMNLALTFQKSYPSYKQTPCLIRSRQRYSRLASYLYITKDVEPKDRSHHLSYEQCSYECMVVHRAWIPRMDWSDCESTPYMHGVLLTDS